MIELIIQIFNYPLSFILREYLLHYHQVAGINFVLLEP